MSLRYAHDTTKLRCHHGRLDAVMGCLHATNARSRHMRRDKPMPCRRRALSAPVVVRINSPRSCHDATPSLHGKQRPLAKCAMCAPHHYGSTRLTTMQSWAPSAEHFSKSRTRCEEVVDDLDSTPWARRLFGVLEGKHLVS